MYLNLIEGSGVSYQAEVDEWQVTSPSTRIELNPSSAEDFPAGWVLIKASLNHQGFGFSGRLVAITKRQQEYSYELPVSLKGTLFELLHFPDDVVSLSFEPLGASGPFSVNQLSLRKVKVHERLYLMWKRVISVVEKQPYDVLYKSGMRWYTPFVNLKGAYALSGGFRAYSPQISYANWIARFDELDNRDVKKISNAVKRIKFPPFIDIVLLGEQNQITTDYLTTQLYPHAGITSFGQLKSDWVLCIDPGVVLRPHALYWLATAIKDNPNALAFYSDHDLLLDNGTRVEPCFKPDWSPEFLLASPYIGPLLLVKRTLLDGLLSKKGNDGVSCYQLALSCLSAVNSVKESSPIIHIPAVLYHWSNGEHIKSLQNSSRQLGMVSDYLAESGAKAKVDLLNHQYHKVVYTPIKEPLVSIIIPTRDTLHHLERSVMSVLTQSTYKNFEIVIADNESAEPETHAFFEKVSRYENVSVVPYNFPFNYSAINNFAVKHSKGDVIVLLNNDTEVISDQWLEVMLGQLQQPSVGAVGVKLLFGDRRVQHAGDAVGPGGCADHFHSRLEEDDPGYFGRAIVAQDLSAVTAACLMVSRHVWEQLDGLDEENLAVAFNDVDFCLRVREAGLRVVFTPYAKLFHHESVSRGKDDSPEKAARAKREADYMRSRWKPIMSHDPFYNPNLNYSRPDFTLNNAPRVNKPWLYAK